MKKTILIAVLAVVVSLCALPALAASVRVIGKVTDMEGKPLPDAHVIFTNPENGQKYDNKTNSKGEYDRIGFNPGNYDVTITDKDKKPLMNMKNVVVSFDKDPNEINFDLAKIAQQPAAGGGLTPEQQKQIDEAKNKNAEIAKEQKLTEAELLAHCRRFLPFSKCPKVIVFGHEVPYTSTGKPKRLELKARLAGTLAAFRDRQFKAE